MHYIELPQTSVDVADGFGVNRSLVTCHGADDLQTLSVEQFRTAILDKGAYIYPINLITARDFSPEATIDDEALYEAIQEIFFCMAFDPITKEIFDQICPNFSNKPQVHVE